MTTRTHACSQLISNEAVWLFTNCRNLFLDEELKLKQDLCY